MRDEFDPQLLRAFADSHRPLADEQFVARVTAQLHGGGGLRAVLAGVRTAVRATLSGLTVGIVAPLRLRYAGLIAVAGALLTAWSLLQAM